MERENGFGMIINKMVAWITPERAQPVNLVSTQLGKAVSGGA